MKNDEAPHLTSVELRAQLARSKLRSSVACAGK